MTMQSVKELKQTRIWKYLNKINPDYAGRCVKLVAGLSPILISISDFFPFYHVVRDVRQSRHREMKIKFRLRRHSMLCSR